MAAIDLTESDNGRTIRARVGDSIALRLPEVAGSGYTWSPISFDDKILELTGSTTEPAGALGGSGLHDFTFRAASPGTTSLQLAYRRSWEASTGQEQSFSVTIEVAVG